MADEDKLESRGDQRAGKSWHIGSGWISKRLVKGKGRGQIMVTYRAQQSRQDMTEGKKGKFKGVKG